MQRWLWGYAGVISFVGAIIVVQNLWCLSKSDWASWVQAIGSIAAIMAAYLLASRQQRLADRAARQDRTRLRYRSASYAVAILEEAANAIGDFLLQLGNQKPDGSLEFDLKRLEDSLAVLMTALHQPLPSEVLDQVLAGLRAVQIQTRIGIKPGLTSVSDLKVFATANAHLAMGAYEKVRASREKWRFELNEASLEE